MKVLKSLGKIVDVSKISIGFETLGTDVLVQQQAWTDPAQTWSTATTAEHAKGIYFHPCTTNMTHENVASVPHNRCGSPLLEQQWGLKFNASEMIGLDEAVKKEFGNSGLAGIGVFTLDGMMWQPAGKTERIWYKPLCDLNKYFKLPCDGPCCTQSHYDEAPEADFSKYIDKEDSFHNHFI